MLCKNNLFQRKYKKKEKTTCNPVMYMGIENNYTFSDIIYNYRLFMLNSVFLKKKFLFRKYHSLQARIAHGHCFPYSAFLSG